MPSTDNPKVNNPKKRLGRGLGSLLGPDVSSFNDEGDSQLSQSKAAPVPKAKQETKATVPQPQKEEGAKPEIKKAEEKAVQEPPVSAKPIENITLSDANRIWSLGIEKIVPNQTQPRKDFLKEPLQELSESIKEQGLLQPITVRKVGEKYEIIAGERRWRASQLAGLQQIPAIVKDVDDQKSMELALIENLQREDLNPVEEAMGYQLLIDDYDISQQEVAQKVGKSRSSVTNALRILSLPRDIRQMVRQGLLTVGHAKVLMSVDNPKNQVKLARKCVNKKLSVRALEKEVLKAKREKADDFSKVDVSERLAHGLAEELQKTLGTKVNIQYKKGKGKLEIAFYSDDELSNYCEKIKDAWKA